MPFAVWAQTDSWTKSSRKADLAFQNAHYNKAVNISLKALEKQTAPKDKIEIQKLLGKCYFKLGKTQQARTQFLKVLKHHPNRLNPKIQLLQLDYKDGRYYSALHYAEEILTDNRQNKDIWIKKAIIYKDLRRYGKAKKTMKIARRLFPQNKRVKKTQQNILIEAGYHSLEKTKLKTAFQDFRDALSIKPKNIQLYKTLIELYLKNQNLETALTLNNQALDHFPENHYFIVKKTVVLQLLHNYQEALEFADKKITTQNKAEIRQLKKSILKKAILDRNNQDTFELYENLYALDPNNKKAFNYLVDKSLEKGYSVKALEYINQRLRQKPRSKLLLLKKLELYKLLKNKSEIRKTLFKLREYYPHNASVFEKLKPFLFKDAQNYFNEKKIRKAQALFEQLKYDKHYGKSSNNYLYSIYLKRGKLLKAREILNHIKNNYAKSALYQVRKADLLKAEGKKKKAYQLMDSLNKVHPNERIFNNYIYEISLPIIQKAIKNKNYNIALSYIQKLLGQQPEHKLILKYQTDVFILSEQFKKAKSSCLKRIKLFPEDQKLKLKLAYIYNKLEKYKKSISIYRNLYWESPDNKTFQKALIHELNTRGSSELQAENFSKAKQTFKKVLRIDPTNTRAIKQIIGLLIRKKSYRKALFWAEKASKHEEMSNKILLITALLYETEDRYKKALTYYSLYNSPPSQKEKLDAHKKYLKSKLLKNRIRVNYRYINSDSLFYASSVASIEYSRRYENSTFLVRANYTSRNREVGLQGEVDLYHTFDEKNNMYANLGIANKLFPRIKAGLSYYRSFEKGWQGELGGRFFYDQIGKSNLFFGVLGIEKYIGNFWLNGQLTFRTNQDLKRHFLFRARKYLTQEKNYISLMAGAGNIPYSNNINYLPREELSFNNFMIGGGFNYNFSLRTGFKLLLNWYYYDIPMRGHSNHYHAFVSLYHNF
jgi:YaiO family outer membrane protein